MDEKRRQIIDRYPLVDKRELDVSFIFMGALAVVFIIAMAVLFCYEMKLKSERLKSNGSTVYVGHGDITTVID